MSVNNNKFIILTTQRTGSTYLRIWLNKHPNIRSHGEIFLNHYQAPDGFNAFLKQNYFLKWKLYQLKSLHPHYQNLLLNDYPKEDNIRAFPYLHSTLPPVVLKH